jgi:hypothetical protein
VGENSFEREQSSFSLHPQRQVILALHQLKYTRGAKFELTRRCWNLRSNAKIGYLEMSGISKQNKTKQQKTKVTKTAKSYASALPASVKERIVEKVVQQDMKSSQPSTDKKKGWIPGFGKTVGGALGGIFGPAGAALGARAGHWFGQATGLGTYSVRKNSFVTSGQITGQGPPLINVSNDGTVICHREFLQDISGSAAFTMQLINPINPGLPTFAPWLSQVAMNYDEYELQGCVVEFVSTSAEFNGVNAAIGSVMISTSYDSYDPAFPDKRSMDSAEYATTSKSCEDQLHPIECDPHLNPIKELYIRTPTIGIQGDRRFYDLGTTYVATQGQNTGAVIGELWVSYKIKLLKPKLVNSYNGYAQIVSDPIGSITTANPFGTSDGRLTAGSNSNMLQRVSATQVLLPSAGIFSFTFFVYATTPIGSQITATGGLNIVPATWFNNSSSAGQSGSLANNGLVPVYYAVMVAGTGPANYITIGGMNAVVAGNSNVVVNFVQPLPGVQALPPAFNGLLPYKNAPDPLRPKMQIAPVMQHFSTEGDVTPMSQDSPVHVGRSAPSGVRIENKDGSSEVIDLSISQASILERVLSFRK